MRHVTLTCRHHPALRWTCKSIAFSPGWGYNGQRHIFFHGPGDECSCSPKDLILAPEDPWHSLSDADARREIDEDIGR